MKRLEWIDALRGYAIIGVMMGHLGLVGPPAPVQLFFLASGIALMYSHESRGNFSARSFYIRRFFRIAPMFWAAIPVFYLQNLIIGKPTADIAQIVSAITFTHWVKPQWNNSAVPGSWSIACEMTFYLFFPFVAAHVTNVRRGIGLVLISVALAICMWPVLMLYADWLGVTDPSHRHGFTFYSFSTQAPCFAIGIVVFRLLEQKQSYTEQKQSHVLAAGLLGLGVTIATSWQLREHADRVFLINTAAYGAIAYALGKGKIGFLVNRLICGIGLVSYSAYFWQFFFLTLSGRAWVVVPLTLAAIYADLLHHRAADDALGCSASVCGKCGRRWLSPQTLSLSSNGLNYTRAHFRLTIAVTSFRLLSKDDARRIAANFAKLPGLLLERRQARCVVR